VRCQCGPVRQWQCQRHYSDSIRRFSTLWAFGCSARSSGMSVSRVSIESHDNLPAFLRRILQSNLLRRQLFHSPAFSLAVDWQGSLIEGRIFVENLSRIRGESFPQTAGYSSLLCNFSEALCDFGSGNLRARQCSQAGCSFAHGNDCLTFSQFLREPRQSC
jgi:hypothetical protein